MHAMKRYGLLGALLSMILIASAATAMAADARSQQKSLSSPQDILADNTDNADNADNADDADDADATDAANDFDSSKESASEEAAPPPQEEDGPLLDEEGNVIKQQQALARNLTPQAPVPEQNSLNQEQTPPFGGVKNEP